MGKTKVVFSAMMKTIFLFLALMQLLWGCKTDRHASNDLQELLLDAPNNFHNIRGEFNGFGRTDKDTFYRTKKIFGGRYITSMSTTLYKKDSGDHHMTRQHLVSIGVQDEWVGFSEAQSIQKRYKDSVRIWLGPNWQESDYVKDWKGWGAKGTRFTKNDVQVIIWYTWNFDKKDSLQYGVSLDVMKEYPEVL